ncbi:MAG: EAL domain-containing protein, partial [Devosiaceae bacterium]|nr:EAL domain-containing protein [Devosiaceae bacterium MH13]
MSIELRHFGFFVAGCVLALVPVLAANWLIGSQASAMADRHLEAQAILARETADEALALIRGDLAVIADASAQCSSHHLRTLRAVSIDNPYIGMAATRGNDGVNLCVAPDIGPTPVQLFDAPVNLFYEGYSVARVRLAGTDTTGLLFALEDGDRSHVSFVPQLGLLKLFASLDPATGMALTLDGQVILARDPALQTTEAEADLEVRTAPLSVGVMRVQVSIDRQRIESSLTDLRRWVTLGGLVVGGIMVLLVNRLVHARPRQVNEIERAINQGEFVPYYQPTFDVGTGQLLGCEVLVRWIKPDGSVLSPGSFIALAEQSGLAVPITQQLMRSVREDLDEAYGVRPDLKVAINLFNQHFDSLDIVEDIEEIFGDSHIAYQQIVLEVTERSPLESVSQAKIVIRKLQDLGCRLALDDAGTGHGGLAYLQELGLDVVKIDKMFIDQLGKNRVGESITHSLTDLAAELGMGVVAEGVESVDQVEHLKRYGIREAQGYLFAPPLPASRYLTLVEKLAPALDPATLLARKLPSGVVSPRPNPAAKGGTKDEQ